MIKRRPGLTTAVGSKEPTHYSQSEGHGVPRRCCGLSSAVYHVWKGEIVEDTRYNKLPFNTNGENKDMTMMKFALTITKTEHVHSTAN